MAPDSAPSSPARNGRRKGKAVSASSAGGGSGTRDDSGAEGGPSELASPTTPGPSTSTSSRRRRGKRRAANAGTASDASSAPSTPGTPNPAPPSPALAPPAIDSVSARAVAMRRTNSGPPRGDSPTSVVAVIDRHLDADVLGAADTSAVRPPSRRSGKRVRIGSEVSVAVTAVVVNSTSAAAGSSSKKGKRRGKTLANHRQTAEAQMSPRVSASIMEFAGESSSGPSTVGPIPGSGTSTPNKSRPRTTRNSLKTPVSPGLPDSTPPRPRRRRGQHRRQAEPFERPSRTTIFKDFEGWFPRGGIPEEEEVVWLQRDDEDIFSPSSWHISREDEIPPPSVPLAAPSSMPLVKQSMDGTGIDDTQLVRGLGQMSLSDLTLESIGAVSAVSAVDDKYCHLDDEKPRAEAEESAMGTDSSIAPTLPPIAPTSAAVFGTLPLRTGEEPPTAGGINISRSQPISSDSTETGTNLSQGSYRHRILIAHMDAAREEERNAWSYRDIPFEDGTVSPTGSEKFFPDDKSLGLPSASSSGGPPSLSRPSSLGINVSRPTHARIPSLTAINTSRIPAAVAAAAAAANGPGVISTPGGSVAPLMQLRKGKKLGHGSHGICWLVTDEATNELYALKEILPQANPIKHRMVLQSLWEEIRLLSSLQHENIVKVVGLLYNALPAPNGSSSGSTPSVASTPATPYTPMSASPAPQLLLEYVSGGSIASLIKSLDPLPLPGNLAAFLGRQVAEGLAYLHSKNVVHRDIKASNILVTSTGVAKISDFGISLDVSEYVETNSNTQPMASSSESLVAGPSMSTYEAVARTEAKGTTYWLAPEATRKAITAKVDCWSFGCLLIEMLSGRHPWPDFDHNTVLYRLALGRDCVPPIPPAMGEETEARYPPPSANSHRSLFEPITPASSDPPATLDLAELGIVNISRRNIVVSPEARTLMQQCLQYDPSARPTALEISRSPFLHKADYDFVGMVPKLLEVARKVQPPPEPEQDMTAVYDYDDHEEEEEEEEEEEGSENLEDEEGDDDGTDVEEYELDEVDEEGFDEDFGDMEDGDGEMETSPETPGIAEDGKKLALG